MSEAATTTESTTSESTETTAGDNGGGIEQQVRDLGSKLDTALERLPEKQQESEAEALSTSDLLDVLLGDEEYEEPGQPQAQVQTPQPQAGTPEAQAEAQAQAMLDQYVERRVEEQLGPVRDAIETRFRQSDLAALADEKKYPELATKQGAEAVRARLEPYVNSYGEGVLTDPGLVEMALRAERAANATATETPAAAARDQGAHLETGAGAGGAAGEGDPNEQIIKEILGAGGPKSRFAG